jgi:hypothetical protein
MKTCEFCNKNYSTNSSLIRHANTCKIKESAKQLLIQKEEYESRIEKLTVQLIEHESQLQQQQQRHESQLQQQQQRHESQLQQQQQQYESQLEKLQEQLDEQKELVKMYQNQIFEIAKQPTSTTHVTTQTQNNRNIAIVNQLAPYDLTRDQVTKWVDQYFGLQTFQGGPDEITKLTAQMVLTDSDTQKPKVTCTDLSRKMFRYIDSEQKVQVDPGFQKTHEMIRNPLFQANLRVFMTDLKCSDEYLNQWRKNSDFIEDSSQFSDKLLKFIPLRL